jgi:hypothetical protein
MDMNKKRIQFAHKHSKHIQHSNTNTIFYILSKVLYFFVLYQNSFCVKTFRVGLNFYFSTQRDLRLITDRTVPIGRRKNGGKTPIQVTLHREHNVVIGETE